LLDQFCRYFGDLRPRRIVLAHLMEFGRAMDDYWDVSHAEMVECHCQEKYGQIEISHSLTGQKVLI
jgi:hypothetical protein